MSLAGFARTVAVVSMLLQSPASASDGLSAQFEPGDEQNVLIYSDATCSDNPECQVASLVCDVTGLSLQLLAVDDQDAAKLLRDASGIRLQAGNQSAIWLPSEMVVDELNGGWDITFGAWMANAEENIELAKELSRSPLELVQVPVSMDLDLPAKGPSLLQQREFAAACAKWK